MTAPATSTSISTPDAGVPTAGQVAGRRWRASRGVVLTVLALVVLAVALASMQPSVGPRYLDPESPSQGGSRALAQILGQRGVPVRTVRDAREALSAARPDTVLVIVRTERLTDEELNALRAAPGDLLLVDPTQPALAALAPGVRPATGSFQEVAGPDCALDAAVRAGEVRFELSQLYLTPPGATRCYPSEGLPRLVQLPVGGRTVTVLGSGNPLTNDRLDEQGNAALAMNLAGARSSVVWLIPDLPEPGSTRARSWQDLVPLGVWLFVLQLAVAVVLVALWRMRRMGPVVAEALPVVVRSAETVEGRARLYRAHRARGSAAEALRAGARDRLVPLLGLPRGAAQDPSMAQEIVSAVARRTQWDERVIGGALYGPEPVDDVQLVGLTDFLDDLERQVRQS
ncbi:protein of unknown function [Thermomonospora echinospora]|uniref:DUF4350 domain-containing protein n=1 Tax=Thermomonospora echinospora TaxID=1992 RepID=A0A1H5WCA6_9ACTN|nr:DUF4350 domain-containing protein [Thermomonospora echinospora]SEF96437.1 protein of unknown function [Thermomonospora echinospora]